MSRTTITLPEDLVTALEEYKADGESWPAFIHTAVLPALEGENVEIRVEGAMESELHDRIDRLESRLDDFEAQLPRKLAEELDRGQSGRF